MSFVGRGGRTTDITVPANQAIIVNSPGPSTSKVYYGAPAAAGNLPTQYVLAGILNQQQATFGPFTTSQIVQIEAGFGTEVEYVIGTNPSLQGTGATAPLNFRNLVDGGDMTVNPFQRNIAGLATAGVIAAAIANTPTYFADRFFGVGGASSAILFSRVADTSISGFNGFAEVPASVWQQQHRADLPRSGDRDGRFGPPAGPDRHVVVLGARGRELLGQLAERAGVFGHWHQRHRGQHGVRLVGRFGYAGEHHADAQHHDDPVSVHRHHPRGRDAGRLSAGLHADRHRGH